MTPRWIKNLLMPKPAADSAGSLSTLAPAGRFYAIGDIHGRLDLLQTLLTALDQDVPLVFLGDYIDRGNYSAQVLRHLLHLSLTPDRKVVCLKGNHEEMLLGFLDHPQERQRIWMHNGGTQTLASFGLINTSDLAADAVAEQLRDAMGEPLLDWIRDRPLIWTSGNITAVHAALDPQKPLDEQAAQTCLWGHPDFTEKSRKDGQWIVHGHTIVDEPRVRGDVIAIDTGAFATDQLTAAEVSDGAVRFVSTSRSGIVRTSA